jgi:hypothetical protein
MQLYSSLLQPRQMPSATRCTNSVSFGVCDDASERLCVRCKGLINALSLTTPVLSSVFRLLYYQTRAHLSVGARTASFSAASAHPCQPNLLSPFPFINSVLPTEHLFDHHRP